MLKEQIYKMKLYNFSNGCIEASFKSNQHQDMFNDGQLCITLHDLYCYHDAIFFVHFYCISEVFWAEVLIETGQIGSFSEI